MRTFYYQKISTVNKAIWVKILNSKVFLVKSTIYIKISVFFLHKLELKYSLSKHYILKIFFFYDNIHIQKSLLIHECNKKKRKYIYTLVFKFSIWCKETLKDDSENPLEVFFVFTMYTHVSCMKNLWRCVESQ